jgi:hypothetical protein
MRLRHIIGTGHSGVSPTSEDIWSVPLGSTPDPINDFDYGFVAMQCNHCKVVYKSAPPTYCLRCGTATVPMPVLCTCMPPCDGINRTNYVHSGCRCDNAVAANRTYHAALRASK